MNTCLMEGVFHTHRMGIMCLYTYKYITNPNDNKLLMHLKKLMFYSINLFIVALALLHRMDAYTGVVL